MQSRRCILLGALFVATALPLRGQGIPSIAEKTAGFTHHDGFFPVFWDAGEGKVYLEIPRMGEDFIYLASLPAGLGSNDIGLDRSQLGATRLVRFERVGPKILLVMPNLRFRAESDDPAERASVREAFAEGVVWGFVAAAEEEGRVLVDATAFVVRDAHGVARSLQRSGQGAFTLDQSRSAPAPDVLKAFPNNTEMEARVTFTSESPGGFVRDVAADPYAVTMRIRHSFVKLPEVGYEPRAFHPGSGYSALSYRDFAAPIGEDMVKRFVRRHRLIRKDSLDAVGHPVTPITYYLDPGTPEPVRGALLEGARWWAEAFEFAGFSNAFRVELLPDGADPMDVRYNTIQWVHRSTRGWSYGSSVADPRTGEIIKGHVSLGSLRVRQDYLIAEGLLAPYADSLSGGPAPDPMLQMALARIRQLSAHEVGHTLGLMHNFAASTDNRSSVMDYPAPLARLAADGAITLEDAYATGVGAWDKVAIAYGYAQRPPGASEEAMLDQILAHAAEQGLSFLTDADARPAGAAHPLANLWDNGSDMIRALDDELRVREVALARFGEATVRMGRPLATLEEVLVPLYLRHRYQIEATVKLIGGVTYSYAHRGDARSLPAATSGDAQRSALERLMQVVQPQALRLPENIRSNIPPRPPGHGPHRELFPGYTGLTFDPYAPAATVASLVLGLILHPERAARTAYQNDFDAALPDLHEVVGFVSSETWGQAIPSDAYDAELQRLVQQAWVDELGALASNARAAHGVRAMVTQELRNLHAWLDENPGHVRDQPTWAHRSLVFDQIDRYLLRDYRMGEGPAQVASPPGSPIGEPDFLVRRRQRREILDRWPRDTCGEERAW